MLRLIIFTTDMTKRDTKIYLCGAITGKPEKEYTKDFADAKERLRRLGFANVISPLENGLPKDASWEAQMRACIPMMMEANVIYVVNNTSSSRGAKVELRLARELEFKVLLFVYSDDKIVEELELIGERK